MNERLIRLIRIITLIQAKPGIMARELSEECETTERTIYRDLEVLSAADIPLTNMGHGQGYEFTGHFAMYPMDWSEQEALAFFMLPSILKQSSQQIPPDFYSAYEKIVATHRKEKKDRYHHLMHLLDIFHIGIPSSQAEKNHFLMPITSAIIEFKVLKVIYHTQSRNVTTHRYLNPYYLIPRNHQFYLIAYCQENEDFRTFRMSRFQEVEVLDVSFQINDFDLQKKLKHTWSIISGDKRISFKVLFSEKAARYIKEEELFVQPKLTENVDGSLLFEVTINDDLEFLQWVKQYGPEAQILAPQEYRQKMKAELEACMVHYQD